MAGDYCPVAFEEVASGTESLAVSALDAVALTGQFAKQGRLISAHFASHLRRFQAAT